MRCLKSILGIRWWHKVTHVETRHRAADIDMAEYMVLQRQLRWIGHVIRMPSNRLPRRLLYGELLNGQRMPGGPKLRYMDHIRRILNKSIIPISDLEKLAADRDRWRSACASGLSTLCQVSDQAAAGRLSHRHHRRNPTATGPRCPQCSRLCACVATFVATPHILDNAPTSTNVIVDVDGLLSKQQATKQSGKFMTSHLADF